MENKIQKVRKRDESLAEFDQEKITKAVHKAIIVVGEGNGEKSQEVSDKVVELINIRFKDGEIATVEQIQDIIEEVLILENLVETSKSFILYREQRRNLRESTKRVEDSIDIIDKYMEELDWQVKENANMGYSLQGLNNYTVAVTNKKYWLNKIYPKEIREVIENGDFHIHDLDVLATYCSGWDLYDLLLKGFRGVPGKVASKPASHFRSALGQVVNFFFTLQGECYSEDTEVLTKSGWKYFREITRNDQIFTLNNDTNEIELQKPVNFFKYDYEGELYNFKSKKLDLLVTPNHSMVVDQYCPKCKNGLYSRKFVKAKDFKKSIHFIPKKSSWVGEKKEWFDLPGIKIIQYRNFKKNSFNLESKALAKNSLNSTAVISDVNKYEIKEINPQRISMNDWLVFFGFFIAEGCTTLRKRIEKERKNPYYEYTVRIAQNKGKTASEFEKTLKKMPFHYNVKEAGEKLEFNIGNKQLFLYLRQFGKSGEKFLPEEIKNLSKDQLEILFSWMMKGDGHVSNGNTEYYSKSKKLADDVQEIVLKLGFNANIYKKKKSSHSWYVVSVSKTNHFKFRNVGKKEYKGKVYCIEVPNHTLYVRRNDKACWCGNCAGAQAFSSFDTLLAPFIRHDNLSYNQVKQAMQEFMFNCAVPTRVGFQCPFTNITLDIKPSSSLSDQPILIGGKPQKETYGEFQQEMDMINKAFYEIIMEGDANGRPFTFPIPTVNITKDFDWDNPALENMWKATAKYGANYFSNFIQSDMSPDDVRSMCLYPEEDILIKEKEEIKKITIGELFDSYKGEKLDKEWFNLNNDISALSLNSNTGKLEWTDITKLLKIEDDQLVTIEAKDGKTMRVSKDHLVAIFTTEGIVTKKAKEITKDDLLLVLKDASEVLNKEQEIDKDLAWFAGLFVADGNYLYDSRCEDKRMRGIQISFNNQEKDLIEKTKKTVKKLLDYDMKFILDKRYGNSLREYIYNSKFSEFLYKEKGVYKYNRLPEWIWSSNIEIIESFLAGFFAGDGYENGKEIHINDEPLSKELNLLFQLVGMSTTYVTKENSQVIRIQHVLGRGSQNNKIIKDKLHNLIPEFILEQKKVIGENGKNIYQCYGCKMVGLSTIDRWNISNEKIEWLRNSDFAVVEVKNVYSQNIEGGQTFYDIELDKNHYFVHSDGNITHNCCRLRLSNKELIKRGGGLFGSNPLTGSIGVVTINLPRIGYLSKTKKDYFARLRKLMDLAKESLEIKRKTIEKFMEKGLYPYSRYYLDGVKKMRGSYYGNHFSTIGLIGMNESLLNFIGEDIGSKKGVRFSLEVLEFMRNVLTEYQEETGNLYNLEATPAEGTSYRLALKDRKQYPDIIEAGTKKVPYYTNSTMLPVNYTDDIFEALDLQDGLQSSYTGGVVFHTFLGEEIKEIESVKKLIKKIFENYHLPYITLTPTFSICPAHGYLSGKHFSCPKCVVNQPCEVYSRVVGYYRPVQQWNKGKEQEYKDRKEYRNKD